MSIEKKIVIGVIFVVSVSTLVGTYLSVNRIQVERRYDTVVISRFCPGFPSHNYFSYYVYLLNHYDYETLEGSLAVTKNDNTVVVRISRDRIIASVFYRDALFVCDDARNAEICHRGEELYNEARINLELDTRVTEALNSPPPFQLP